MNKIEYAQSLVDKGVSKEEFVSLMDQFDLDPNSIIDESNVEEEVVEEDLVVDEAGKLIDVAESSATVTSGNLNAENTDLNSGESSSESLTQFDPSNLTTEIDGGPEGGPEDVGGPGEIDTYGLKGWQTLLPGKKIMLNPDDKAHAGSNPVYTDADKQKYGFHTSKKRKFLQPGKKIDEVKFTQQQFVGDGPDDLDLDVLNTMFSKYAPRGKKSTSTDYFDNKIGEFKGEDGEDEFIVGILTTDVREKYTGEKKKQQVIDLPGQSDQEFGMVSQQSKLFHKIPVMTKRKYYEEWLNDKEYGKDAGVDLHTYLYEYKDENGDYPEDAYSYSTEGTFLEDIPNQVDFASNKEVKMQKDNNANIFETDPKNRVVPDPVNEGKFQIGLLPELEITSESTAPGLIDANPFDDNYQIETIQASLDNIDSQLRDNIFKEVLDDGDNITMPLTDEKRKELNIEREKLVNDQNKYISARTAATINLAAYDRYRLEVTEDVKSGIAKPGAGAAGLFGYVKYKDGEFFVQPKRAGGYGGSEEVGANERQNFLGIGNKGTLQVVEEQYEEPQDFLEKFNSKYGAFGIVGGLSDDGETIVLAAKNRTQTPKFITEGEDAGKIDLEASFGPSTMGSMGGSVSKVLTGQSGLDRAIKNGTAFSFKLEDLGDGIGNDGKSLSTEGNNVLNLMDWINKQERVFDVDKTSLPLYGGEEVLKDMERGALKVNENISKSLNSLSKNQEKGNALIYKLNELVSEKTDVVNSLKSDFENAESKIAEKNKYLNTLNIDVEQRSKAYTEEVEKVKAKLKNAKTQEEGQKIINEFKAYEDDYNSNIESIKKQYEITEKEFSQIQSNYQNIYDEKNKSFDKSDKKYNKFKDNLTVISQETSRALLDANMFQKQLFVLENNSIGLNKVYQKIQKDGWGEGSPIGALWNSFEESFVSSMAGGQITLSHVADMFNEIGNWFYHRGFTNVGISDSKYRYNKGITESSRLQLPAQIDGIVDFLKDQGVDDLYAEKFANTTLGGIATTFSQMFGATLGSGYGWSPLGFAKGFFDMKLVDTQGEINDIRSDFMANFNGSSAEAMEAFEKQFPKSKQIGYSYTQATVEGTLEFLSGKIFSGGGSKIVKPLSTKIVNGLVGTVFKNNVGKKLTLDQIQAQVSKVIGDKLTKYIAKGGSMTTAGFEEFLTEISQTFAEIGIKEQFNETLGKDVQFDVVDTDSEEFKEQMVHLFKVSFGAGMLGGMSNANIDTKGKVLKDFNSMSIDQQANLNEMLTILQNQTASVENYNTQVSNINSSNITADQKQKAIAEQTLAHEIAKEINPNLTGIARQEISQIMRAIKILEKQKAKHNNKSSANVDKRIKELEGRIEEISLTDQTRKTDIENAIAKNVDLSKKIVEKRGKGKITFANNQLEFVEALEDSNVEMQAFDSEGNLIADNTRAEALYLQDGSGDIIINMEKMSDMNSISAGTHEILHDITADQLKDMSQEEKNIFIKDFKELLSKGELAVVKARLDANYNGDMSTSEEWLNAFHDAVVRGDLTYNETLGGKLGNWMYKNIFSKIKWKGKPLFKKDISFDSPEGAYNFVKNYSIETKEIMEGTRQDFSEDVGNIVYETEENIDNIPIAKEIDLKEDVEVNENIKAAASMSEGVQDETSENKKTRQDTRNTVVEEIYNNNAAGKSKQEWQEFLETPEGRVVMDEMLAGTTLIDENGNIVPVSSRAERREKLKNPKIKEINTSYLPDMIAIAKRKGLQSPTEAAYAGIDPLMKHIKAFDPSQNNDLAGYVGGYLGLKTMSGGKKVMDKADTISMEKEGVSQAVEKQGASQPSGTSQEEKETPQFFIKDRLGEKAQAIDKKVKAMASGVNTKGKGYKQTPKLALKETVEMFMSDPKAVYIDDGSSFWKTPKGEKTLGTPIAESILNKIENNAALNGQDIKAVQQFLMKNKQTLMSGALAEGTDPSGKSTGMAKVLLDKFYSKGDRVAMTKTGSKQGLAKQSKKENIDDSVYDDLFGITKAGTPNVQNVSTSSQPVKAIIRATEKILTNQALRQAQPTATKMGEGRAKAMKSASSGKVDLNPSNIFMSAENMSYAQNQFSNYQKGWPRLIKELGLKPLKSNNKKDIEAYENWVEDNLLSELPIEFFVGGNFAGSGAVNNSIRDKDGKKIKFKKNGKLTDLREYTLKDGSKIKNNDPSFDSKINNLMPAKGYFMPNVGVLENVIAKKAKAISDKENISIEEARLKVFAKSNPNIDALMTRVNYTTGVGVKRKLNEKFFKDTFNGKIKFNGKEISFEEFNKKKLEGLKDIFKKFESMMSTEKKKKENAPFIAALLSSTSSGMGHFIRIAAPVKFYDTSINGGVIVEEHTLPATLVAQYLFASAVEGKVDTNFENIANNYFQGALSKVNDNKLKGTNKEGEWFNYTDRTPAGWEISDNIWARYFNENTGYINGGINPETIILSDGNSVAKKFNVDSVGKSTPDLSQLQNKLIAEKSDNPKLNTKGEIKEFNKISDSKQKSKLKTENTLKKTGVASVSDGMTTDQIVEKAKKIDEAIRKANGINQPIKKIRVFDFDDTMATTKSDVLYTAPDGKEGKLNAEEFAKQGKDLLDQGYVFDFSEFNKVTKGKKGPLWKVAEKIKETRGNEDLFILTARAPQAQEAIYEFLKSEGLEFKAENIIGLGNSTGEAKANWIVDKAAEGYNDFYFADDAVANVKAVKKALSVIDVKSKVQQAKIKANMSTSSGLSDKFNSFLEGKTGIGAEKIFSDSKAKVRGKNKFQFFIPHSAEDMLGLLYTTINKGKKGEQQLDFYKETILRPYAKAMSNLAADRNQLMADFKKLKKELNVPKNLRKTTESGYTNEQAVRVYLYTAMGYETPGLSKTDLNELNSIIENDPQLKTFAEQILVLTKGDGYSKPGENWLSGTITTDLIELLNKEKRSKYLEDWQENVDAIFSKENLNKLEAAFGSKYRESLENMLDRMKSGKNRSISTDRLTNAAMDYLNGSIGTIMFLNMRSALLQTISATNYMNWTFNNPAKMGAAILNTPQFAKDFLMLMNSQYLKDRRNGLKLNISESEIANAAATSKNKAKAIINLIIEKGYTPTKFADSFAIASGGATFYRNRLKDLMKNNPEMSEKEASEITMNEFIEKSEESQQSSDPSKISKQQTTLMGRLLLQFVNTPMQYSRLQKRAFQDMLAGRGSKKEHISKILYYAGIQNLWFNAMQKGLFLLAFGGDDDEEKTESQIANEEKKYFGTINGMVDSILRGVGFAGMTVSVLKNFGINVYDRSQRQRPEYSDAWITLLEFSPSIRKKLMNVKNAGWAFDSKKRRQEMIDKGFSIDNPAVLAGAQMLNTITNIPLDRLIQKVENMREVFAEDTEAWEAAFIVAGWPAWDVKKNKIAAKYALDNPDIYETWQQKSILRQYGLSDQEIKNLKNSTNRVKEIDKLQKENKNQILPKNEDKKDFYKPRNSTKKIEETGVKLRGSNTGVKTRSSGEVKVRNRIKTQ